MNSNNTAHTLISILYDNAKRYPEKLAYTFLSENKKNSCTNQELLTRVMGIASRLLSVAQPKARAILLLPPGLDYIISFLGCLMAGIVAVPAYPPRGNRHAERIKSIIHDAKAEVLLTTTAIAEQYVFDKVQIVHIGDNHDDEVHSELFPELSPIDLAFLQYTSGSTGAPKGVMVSHSNVIANVALIQELLGERPTTLCSWLPPFHDMGLVGAILYPLAINMHSVLMAPTTFLKAPFFWLKAISDYKANISPAPNFAYELCINSVSEAEKEQLDLSNWLIALNGAEPVNAATLKRFGAAFKDCGFQEHYCYPAYGMAETTLMVTGKKPESSTTVLHVDKLTLQEVSEVKLLTGEQGSLPIVGCGHTAFAHEIKIINPESVELPPYQIGEIVVSGPTVANGYWDKPEISEQIFALKLASSDKKYLRTGDLGFLDQYGELFVTGRLKDLIIIRGHNIYPQDIEAVIQDSHPSLIQHGCAAFTLEIDNELELVVVQEIHRRVKDFDPVFSVILQRCSEELPILPACIILIQQATLPKTSSGKVQRSACRQAVITGDLKIIAKWNKARRNSHSSFVADTTQLQRWMREWFAEHLHLDLEQIDPLVNFVYYGVDSSLAVQFCGALEKRVYKEVNPSLLWSYPTIVQLANYLESDPTDKKTPLEYQAPHQSAEPIAIVGMSCRFPGGVHTPEQFWELLQAGKNGIQSIPENRWDNDLYYDPQPGTAGKMVSSQGGFIDNIDYFDAALFSISRREAEAMDPQHRLLLELTWEALERAGIAPLSLDQSNTGIFIGISSNDYSQLAQNVPYHNADAYYGIGNAHSAAAGRIAYFLGTHGETIAVDTACSSSLVAVFDACRNLHDKSCDLAVAGGVNSILDPSLSVSFSQAGMLSPSGKCQVFDAKADGYVRSEGCGVLILKRLSDAQRDKDNILAVIQSAAVNSDGHSNGITAPSPQAQRDLINHALDLAGLPADAIGYVEAHGTGTRLGDPIEFTALKDVFATNTREQPLLIGSVKSNIGHLEAAAGMAGLIKTILMLQHQKIPANLHFETVNPLIDLGAIPAQVPTVLQPWQTTATQQIRYAGVSSFGFTGTNAHLILSEPPPVESPVAEPTTWKRPVHLFTLSGHTPEALVAQQSHLLEFIQHQKQLDLACLCHSLAIDRSALAYRLAFPVRSHDELIANLQTHVVSAEPIHIGSNKIAFLFTGQGAQYTQMGLELYQTHPLFRAEVDHCSQLLAEYLPESLISVMFDEEQASLLEQTQYTQPAIFVLQYALAKLWLSWGIQPAALIGHSVGEYVAATVAGVMALEDGLKLIAHRGRLMQEQQAGSMLAVNTDNLRAQELLIEFKRHAPDAILNIAAVNSVNQVVFSGGAEEIIRFNQHCQSLQLNTTKLHVSHAFHSELMRPMLVEFAKIAASVQYHEPKITLISNVYGKAISSITSFYWVEHVRATVQFSAGIEELIQAEYQVFIEMGPQPVLLSFAKAQHPQASKALWLASLRKGQTNWQTLTESLATFYQQGNTVNWRAYDESFHIQPHVTSLPTYSFQHQSYWLPANAGFRDHALQDDFIRQSLYHTEWQRMVIPAALTQSQEHTGKWLLFVNQDQESQDLVNQLATYLPEYVVVTPSLTYQSSSTAARLNPQQPEHFQQLLSEHHEFRGVIYLWGMVASEWLQSSSLPNMSVNELHLLVTHSCAGLLHLVQALMQQKQRGAFWAVTRATTTAHHDVIPMFAPLLGMGKTLLLEYPELHYHHLDVDVDSSIEQTSAQLHQLIAQPQDEFLFAYHHDELVVPRIRSVPFTPVTEDKKILHSNATYLITGGLGGLGCALSKWLIKQEVKSIILLGRRPFTQEIAREINKLNMQDLSIQYVQADVSDYTQLRQALINTQATIPAIKGIFHMAGLLNDSLWSNLTWQDFETVFQAKVDGTWNLHQLSTELMPELEHFVLFSSISSLLGSPGQANYAAANAFMDNLAHYRKQLGLPALSINFGPWQQIGMTRDLEQSWLSYGINSINEKLGMAALQRMMEMSFTQLCLMPNHISAQSLHLPSYYKKLLTDIIPESTETRTLNTAPQHKDRIDVSESFVRMVRTILRLNESDKLPMNASLLSLGMDSVLAIELLHQLNSEFSIENLSIQNLLFENRSINELVTLLHERGGDSQQGENNKDKQLERNSPANHLLQLSVQQTRIWRHIQAQPTNPAYIITNFLNLEGEVNAEHLEHSIQQVIARHAMLRCSVHTSLGTPFQFCHDKVDFKLQILDLSNLDTKKQTQKINRYLNEISQQPFDLSHAPLLTSYLIKRAEQSYVWALRVSHLLTDGSSSLILLQDILHFYTLNQKGSSQTLACAVPYQDFIDWQLGKVVDGTYEQYTTFWQSVLQNYTPPVLPTDKPIPQQALTYGAKEPILISAKTVIALQDLAKHSEVTLANLLLTAYGFLLAQFAKTEDAFITMLCAGRESEHYQTTIGNIANEMPLILNFPPEMTFVAVAKQLQSSLVKSSAHQYLQPEQMVELALPVPDVSFDFQNIELNPIDLNFKFKSIGFEAAHIPLWGPNPRKLSLKFNYNGVLSGYLKYRIDLYNAETITQLTQQFEKIIQEIIKKPECTCGNLANLELYYE